MQTNQDYTVVITKHKHTLSNSTLAFINTPCAVIRFCFCIFWSVSTRLKLSWAHAAHERLCIFHRSTTTPPLCLALISPPSSLISTPSHLPSLYFAVRQSVRLKERERATNCQRRAEFAFTCLICEERTEEIGMRGLSSVIQLFWILGDLSRSQRSFITPACSQTWGQFFSRFELLHS